MSGRFRGSLKPAHFGYLYQDLITAYVLAEGLVHRYDSITVDKKVVEDDRIDDLEIVHAGHRKRFQIKSSQDDSRRLQTGDFTSKDNSVKHRFRTKRHYFVLCAGECEHGTLAISRQAERKRYRYVPLSNGL